jgi:hypothetical protein
VGRPHDSQNLTSSEQTLSTLAAKPFVIRSVPDSVMEFNEGRTQVCARRGTPSCSGTWQPCYCCWRRCRRRTHPSTNKGRHLDIPAISRKANGSIVSIVMSDKDGHPLAQGSGFLISKDGHVVPTTTSSRTAALLSLNSLTVPSLLSMGCLHPTKIATWLSSRRMGTTFGR